MEAAAGPGPEPVGHLVVTKPLPYTRRWLALLLPLHPPSLLGTDLNQGDAQILSPGASLRPREVRVQSRRMPLPRADVNPGLCKYALSSIARSPRDAPGSPRGRAEPGRDGAQTARVPHLCAQPRPLRPRKRAAGGWAATARSGSSRTRKNKEGKGGILRSIWLFQGKGLQKMLTHQKTAQSALRFRTKGRCFP